PRCLTLAWGWKILNLKNTGIGNENKDIFTDHINT
ncbi:MAG: hypothetical protein ACI89A_000740, partial [Porticoccaceae bacterium]